MKKWAQPKTEMIEQFSNVLAQIIFNREIKKYEQAESEIRKAYKDLLGSDREFILSLSDDAILQLFKSSSETGYERCVLIAELLNEEAQIIESKGGSARLASDLYNKAFSVLAQVIIESKYWRQEVYLKKSNSCQLSFAEIIFSYNFYISICVPTIIFSERYILFIHQW